LHTIHIPDRPDPSVVPDYVTDMIVPQQKPQPVVAQNAPSETKAPEPKAPPKPQPSNNSGNAGNAKPTVDPVEAAKEQAARVAAQTAQARSFGIAGAFGVQTDDPSAIAASTSSGNVDLSKVTQGLSGVSMSGNGKDNSLVAAAGTNATGSTASIGTLGVSAPTGETSTAQRTQDTSTVAAHVDTGQSQVDTSSSGSLTQGIVDSEVKHLLGAVQSCYQRELKTNPGMKHVAITVDFTIGTHGSVTDTSIESDAGGDGTLENCIQGVIKGQARFAPPPPSETDVTYPFILTGQ
jgi:hypothetical protein